ncbi:dihydrolipoamide acetyltransferase family protein [Agromyces archimandritae]|uniref:Dihydrolipoamide acetyltransferase component of pyruvate dehydrogenase complex n=1 Tax=Agromyces archimandritae TaxID=2781962 RepID=A0A975FM95_9MICO|nr:dihydrolipoamide acetyltransferase family protein [Agromyces archimandritae]QTX04720.1 2-oxo acid dehydrogenase subunit E2 [Agromyces archimandritae]
MTHEFILPDLGEGLTEAEIVAWLVAPGDEVAVDQPVVELESAKSVVQLPTPHAGTVVSLGGEVGEVLHAGAVLLTLSGADAAPAAPDDAAGADAGRASTESQPGEESGAVLIGYGTRASRATKRAAGAGSRFGRTATTASASEPAASGPAASAAAPASTGEAAPSLDPARRSPVVSPIVRRLARENGFDASRLIGSGPDRLVVRRDVEAYIRSGRGSHVGAEAPAAAPAAPAVASGGVRRQPLGPAARAAAAQFTRSRREIPEATVWVDVDASGLVAARRELQEATGERFGFTALLARFAIAGLARHPALNASFDAERSELVLHDEVHLGLAAQTPRGLMVPVVHGAGGLDLRGLRDAIADRTHQAGEGAFPPDALAGGTFTLNNYGTLGVDGSAAIINHPEVAMLGVGRFIERPWVVDGRIEARTVTELTLSFDHRVCDGAEAAAFLTFVAGCIERPMRLLAEL